MTSTENVRYYLNSHRHCTLRCETTKPNTLLSTRLAQLSITVSLRPYTDIVIIIIILCNILRACGVCVVNGKSNNDYNLIEAEKNITTVNHRTIIVLL